MGEAGRLTAHDGKVRMRAVRVHGAEGAGVGVVLHLQGELHGRDLDQLKVAPLQWTAVHGRFEVRRTLQGGRGFEVLRWLRDSLSTPPS